MVLDFGFGGETRIKGPRRQHEHRRIHWEIIVRSLDKNYARSWRESLHSLDKPTNAGGEEGEINKMQLIWCLLSNFYLSMFRVSLCPSSGEQDCV